MRRVSSPKQLKHWTDTLEDLEIFYKANHMPRGPIQLSACEIITDPAKFVRSSLATARANFGNPTFAPYVSRLIQFKKLLISLNQKAA